MDPAPCTEEALSGIFGRGSKDRKSVGRSNEHLENYEESKEKKDNIEKRQ